MENLRRAIARVGKQVKTLQGLRERKFVDVNYGERMGQNGGVVGKGDHVAKTGNIDTDKIDPQLRRVHTTRYPSGFERIVGGSDKKRFKEFLQPVEVDNLKILKPHTEKYNSEGARNEWSRKRSKDRLVVYQRFVDNQNNFNSIMDMLVALTPEKLFPKSEYNYKNIINDYERQRERSKYNTPKYSFEPVPKFSSDMTPPEFDSYVDTLTSTKYLYENSSSTNGIVSDILLYTHRIDNLEFKGLRTVKTFNNLIKWFGYNKNQGLFARSLLVSMKKDGIDPDIETVNTLLKTMSLGIRGYSNKLILIKNYLHLCKQYKMEANLLTWSRVYGLLDNIYLKEVFLNKVSSMDLPITRDMIYVVVDDYMKVGDDIIKFIEQDVNMKDWRNDTKLVNKVNYFLAKNGVEVNECNEYSAPYLMRGIRDSSLSSERKVERMMQVFEPRLECFRMVISELNKVGNDIDTVAKVMGQLLDEFRAIGGDSIQLKYFIRDVYELEVKLRYFGYDIGESGKKEMKEKVQEKVKEKAQDQEEKLKEKSEDQERRSLQEQRNPQNVQEQTRLERGIQQRKVHEQREQESQGDFLNQNQLKQKQQRKEQKPSHHGQRNQVHNQEHIVPQHNNTDNANKVKQPNQESVNLQHQQHASRDLAKELVFKVIPFKVPEKLLKRQTMGKIHKMTGKKYQMHNTSIEQRLAKSNYI